MIAAALVVGCSEKSVQPVTPRDLPPQVVETFEAQTLIAERETLTIDFSTTFKDPEEAAMTYMASSSNESVLTVTIAGAVLKIRPLMEGNATVTITATDPGGNSATVTIPITVKPSPAHPDDDETYFALAGLSVDASQVVFFGMTAQGVGSCIEVDQQQTFGEGLAAARYQIHHSRWQTQDELGWITIPGTERNDNRLCAYTPTETGLYRLVGEVTTTSVFGGQSEVRFSSNVLNH